MKLNILRAKSHCMARMGLALAVIAMPVSAQQQNPVPARYTVTDLGPAPGQPFVLTSNGLVSGQVILPNGASNVSHAVLW